MVSVSHGGDFLRIGAHPSGRGAYAARDADSMQVIARDTFIHFAEKQCSGTATRRGVCGGCGAFVGTISSSLNPNVSAIKLPDTSLQTWIIHASSSSHQDPHCDREYQPEACVSFAQLESATFELMAARLLVLYVTFLTPQSSDWQRLLATYPALGKKMEWFEKLHHDVSTVEPYFVEHAEERVKQLSQLLSPEKREIISTDLWLQTISKVALNSIDVKIPHPMIRYVASLEEEMPEEVRAEAYLGLQRILADFSSIDDENDDETDSQGENESENEKENDSENDSKNESESESESEQSGSEIDSADEDDEELLFQVPSGGSTRTFSTAIFPPSEGTALLGFCASINHSCEPNCEIVYMHDANALVVSTRAISEGEELTIPYVPTNLPIQKRRNVLFKRYGFYCECTKCRRELESLNNRPSKRARV